jgi:hypothetical protein
LLARALLQRRCPLPPFPPPLLQLLLPLRAAASARAVGNVRALLAAGADANGAAADGVTPLIAAARSGSADAVAVLAPGLLVLGLALSGSVWLLRKRALFEQLALASVLTWLFVSFWLWPILNPLRTPRAIMQGYYQELNKCRIGPSWCAFNTPWCDHASGWCAAPTMAFWQACAPYPMINGPHDWMAMRGPLRRPTGTNCRGACRMFLPIFRLFSTLPLRHGQ